VSSKGRGGVVTIRCLNFIEGLGRSIAVRFTVVNLAIRSAPQNAHNNNPKTHRGDSISRSYRLAPLRIVSPNIAPEADVVPPLKNFNEGNTDANGKSQKYSDFD
jgi:hypothetical protein